ncbi:hypothetical protein WOSG25_012540 [Weissella oryzae SG25]|uniref:Uncharacterized protein n=1 Tax=Weissella oryzae (strain DSM 25784 / JCM 18191 / LMG 30913 / SG25) TaxID=1329250 RepID=A0A069CRZ9_WEIOS|nr:hypothetical protein [Weissella oryzae]GAK30157.1 hypothetical protein WOSG25_012540 [Weissella oryzae SG25]
MENYLPVRDSVGYINLKQAMNNVFLINLDEIAIRESNYENFSFELPGFGKNVRIGITATAKNQQFNAGSGGILSIMVENPSYPQDSIMPITPFYNLVEEDLREKVEYAFGKNSKELETALEIFKELYLQ